MVSPRSSKVWYSSFYALKKVSQQEANAHPLQRCQSRSLDCCIDSCSIAKKPMHILAQTISIIKVAFFFNAIFVFKTVFVFKEVFVSQIDFVVEVVKEVFVSQIDFVVKIFKEVFISEIDFIVKIVFVFNIIVKVVVLVATWLEE